MNAAKNILYQPSDRNIYSTKPCIIAITSHKRGSFPQQLCADHMPKFNFIANDARRRAAAHQSFPSEEHMSGGLVHNEWVFCRSNRKGFYVERDIHDMNTMNDASVF